MPLLAVLTVRRRLGRPPGCTFRSKPSATPFDCQPDGSRHGQVANARKDYPGGVAAPASVDVNRGAHWDYAIQGFDVLVADANAAVRDRPSHRGRNVGAMNGISVTEVQAVWAQNAAVTALVGAEWRDDDDAVHDDIGSRRENGTTAIWEHAYDIAPHYRELRPVPERYTLTAVQPS